MKVLSVQQPWAYAIFRLGKNVECRSWRTTYRGLLAIHASQRVDREGIDWLRKHGFEVPDQLPTGVILGTVRLTGVVEGHVSIWADPGDKHWLIERALEWREPIAAKGDLGIWEWEGGEVRG